MVIQHYIKSKTLTRIVPLTICELDSLTLLHEKHVVSLHNLPDSWVSHLLSGG